MTGDWAFRVASRPEVGGGHVARCRAVAEAMPIHAPVTFVLDPDGAAWKPKLQNAGIKAICEGEAGPEEWVGCLMDGYQFNENDVANWKKKSGFLAFVDDFGTPPSMVDLAIAPSLLVETGAGLGIPYLSGPKYAMISAAFGHLIPPLIKNEIEHLLISFGLRDSNNATSIVLDAVEGLGTAGCFQSVTVALGPDAPHRASVLEMVANLSIVVKVASATVDFCALMNKTDMVIGAGGVNLFERMASARPSITLTTAKNQEPSARAASQAGATQYLGDCWDIEPSNLAGRIDDFASNVNLRRKMSSRAREFVDGNGAARVSKALLELSKGRWR